MHDQGEHQKAHTSAFFFSSIADNIGSTGGDQEPSITLQGWTTTYDQDSRCPLPAPSTW